MLTVVCDLSLVMSYLYDMIPSKVVAHRQGLWVSGLSRYYSQPERWLVIVADDLAFSSLHLDWCS